MLVHKADLIVIVRTRLSQVNVRFWLDCDCQSVAKLYFSA